MDLSGGNPGAEKSVESTAGIHCTRVFRGAELGIPFSERSVESTAGIPCARVFRGLCGAFLVPPHFWKTKRSGEECGFALGLTPRDISWSALSPPTRSTVRSRG